MGSEKWVEKKEEKEVSSEYRGMQSDKRVEGYEEWEVNIGD